MLCPPASRVTVVFKPHDFPVSLLPGCGGNVQIPVSVEVRCNRFKGGRKFANGVPYPTVRVSWILSLFVPGDLVCLQVIRKQRGQSKGHQDVQVPVLVEVHRTAVNGVNRAVFDLVPLPAWVCWVTGICVPHEWPAMGSILRWPGSGAQ